MVYSAVPYILLFKKYMLNKKYTTVYDKYRDFSIERGIIPVTSNMFSRELKKCGLDTIRVNRNYRQYRIIVERGK